MIFSQRSATLGVAAKEREEPMHIGAAILGILGGLVALSYGWLGYGLGAMGSNSAMQFLSIAIPLLALVGGGVVASKGMIGAAMMGIATLGIILLLGFNFFTLIPIVLLGVGTALGVVHGQSQVSKVS
jgi:hypothetical protein